MSKTNVLTKPKYNKLLEDIRRLIEAGKTAARQVAGGELLKTYWNVGKRLSAEHLSPTAGYADSVLLDISRELSIDATTLKRCIQFFNTYSSATSSVGINWSHIKWLLPITDKKERAWYENLIIQQKVNVNDLASAIKSDRYAQEQPSQKNRKKQKIKRPTEPTYLYKAQVKRVIDGDTLLLNIDLGFQVFKEQRVRLSQIDAPELKDKRGQEAKQFVLNQLARVKFVMVKTNKIDIYGRYVGDIFYSFLSDEKNKIFLQGRYLNQELLNKSLAEIL